MTRRPCIVLCVVGTSARNSATHTVMREVIKRIQALEMEVDVFDPSEEPLALFNPESSHSSADYRRLKERVDRADVFVLGTPDYHGSISSTLKNFLDHFWQEFTGRLFAPLVVSNEKGLTVIDQLRTVARQCYAWVLPYGVSIHGQTDIQGGQLVSDALQQRLEMLAHDIRTYGSLLARAREADIAGDQPTFIGRLRKK